MTSNRSNQLQEKPNVHEHSFALLLSSISYVLRQSYLAWP